jgi:hypothetical protein
VGFFGDLLEETGLSGLLSDGAWRTLKNGKRIKIGTDGRIVAGLPLEDADRLVPAHVAKVPPDGLPRARRGSREANYGRSRGSPSANCGRSLLHGIA